MKKLFIILLLSAVTLFAADNDKQISDRFHLGKTKAQIYVLYGNPTAKGKGFVVYTKYYAGYPAEYGYMLDRNNVVYMTAIFLTVDQYGRGALNEYINLQDKLESKYGKFSTEIKWKNDMYKDDSKYWGTALSLGAMDVIKKKKISANTMINHRTYGQDMKIYHVVYYIDIKLYDLHHAYRRNKIKEGI